MDSGFSRVGERPQAPHVVFVVLQDVPARSCDADSVEEAKEVGVEHLDQTRAPALRLRLPGPGRESPLRCLRRLQDGIEVKAFRAAEEAVGLRFTRDVPSGNEGDLVPEVAKVAVDRSGGQHEDFRVDSAAHDVLHQLLVARLSHGLAVNLSAAGVVPEVVGFVDDDEVVVPPVDGGEVGFTAPTDVAGEVGMKQDVVAEAVLHERVD